MTEPRSLTVQSKSSPAICPQPPAIVANARKNARFAWNEFFAAQIRNPHTRAAYSFAIRRFFAWLEPRKIALPDIEPATVGAYFAEHPGSVPTKKMHLAALRAE
jgi:integrase/recombinase XerD